MNYYIFRHAETYFTKNEIPYYDDQIKTAKILEEGIPAIRKLSKYLKDKNADAHFSSPYSRCKKTVEIVGKIVGKEFVFDKRLSEFNEESINHMVKRLISFYEEVQSKNFRNVAICTHGYPIAVLISLAIKGKFELEDLNSYPGPGILIEIINSKINLIDFN